MKKKLFILIMQITIIILLFATTEKKNTIKKDSTASKETVFIDTCIYETTALVSTISTYSETTTTTIQETSTTSAPETNTTITNTEGSTKKTTNTTTKISTTTTTSKTTTAITITKTTTSITKATTTTTQKKESNNMDLVGTFKLTYYIPTSKQNPNTLVGGSGRKLIDCSVGDGTVKGSVACRAVYEKYGYKYNGKRTMIYLDVPNFKSLTGYYYVDDCCGGKSTVDIYYNSKNNCPFKNIGVIRGAKCYIVNY